MMWQGCSPRTTYALNSPITSNLSLQGGHDRGRRYRKEDAGKLESQRRGRLQELHLLVVAVKDKGPS